MTALASCRQVLGIHSDDDAPLTADASPAATSQESGTEAGTPFSVVQGVPQGETLTAISGSDKDHFIAVGSSEVSYIYTSGSFQRLGGELAGHDYNGVWVNTPTDAYAVGAIQNGGGFVEHFDGNGWTEVFSSLVGLYGVWGVSDGHVFASGEQGQVYGYKPGDTWRSLFQVPANADIPATPNAPTLWAMSGKDLTDWAIAGDIDYFLHWEPNAGGLAYYEPTVETTTAFRSVWQAPSGGTSVFFGTNYYGLYWFTAPSTVPPTLPADASVLPPGSGYILAQLGRDDTVADGKDKYIEGVWGTAAKIVAVGDDGRIYAFDVASATTTRIASPTDSSFGGVWGTAQNDVWIVGANELILHGAIP